MLYTRTINDVELSFDDRGMVSSEPTIVCLPSLGQDHRGYKYILPFLVGKYRVIRIVWRGHGSNRDPMDKWSVEDQASDTIALLDSLQVQTFIPISHSHGGWCAMEMAARLGKERVPAILLTDLILTQPPPEFIKHLQKAQNKDTWYEAQAALVKGWLDNTTNKNVLDHFQNDVGAHGFENWPHFCWLVEKNYERWGSPMERLETINDPPLVRHVFSHPRDEAYFAAHDEFARKHSKWFSFARLNGESHFPVVELPEAVSLQLSDLVKQVTSKQ
ncbi:1H-3-hydroxy-4-oxoquinaldine 2,4-dioxygenase [Fusarium oxysporum f. sp. cubense]|uniref:1H-3-hydroxy-4-oxoquinaldine 2,4-dioxygenase n=1 Tax=Fusarium oxysporum f. sp. cubense TaxID=61366 RepID=A0A559L6A1_FUSOC|nr:1H-3-hydroxy-4-oxoquinaldine 2,4-dioxygenase [Fusarium oxysporum f. sp. cubense]